MSKKSTFIIAIFSLLAICSTWQVMNIYFIGYPAIGWYTHLLFPIVITTIAWLFLSILYRLFRKEYFQRGKMFLFSLAVLWFSLELLLAITGINKTTSEKNNGFYLSIYALDASNYYRIFPSHITRTDNQKEFHFSRTTNALGYPDSEWKIEKKTTEYRIACIGDSFTEGIGADKDSSYVRWLEKSISAYAPITAMNAGISGSDPYFGFVNYRDRIAPYKPDLVIQTLSTNDILNDIQIRGGIERFVSNNTIRYKKGNTGENLYAISYVSRFFFHACGYHFGTVNEKPSPQEQQEINTGLQELFQSYGDICSKNNARLFLVLLPMNYEVVNQKYNYDFTPILETLPNHVSYVDLLPYYIQTMHLQDKKIENYYWPLDGHHKANGYKMMADGVFEKLLLDSLWNTN